MWYILMSATSLVRVIVFLADRSAIHHQPTYTLCGQTSKHLKGQLWPRVRDVFAYSCPAPPPLVSCDPAFVTFLLIPALPHLPWSVVTPRSWRFCLFLPRPPSPVQSCYDWIKHIIFGKRIIWKIQNKSKHLKGQFDLVLVTFLLIPAPRSVVSLR